MAIAPARTVLSSAPTVRAHSRALHALPITALLVDLAVIAVTVLLAVYGRNHLLLFGTSNVTESATLVALPLVVCWVVVQFPGVLQSAWTVFVWPLPVSLSCWDDWSIVNVSPEFPVCVAVPTPLWT